jgi:epoxyqueuosine reductase
VTRERIRAAIEANGLIFLGIVSPETNTDYSRFRLWLEENRHAGMQYLESHPGSREHARSILPDAQSVVVFALAYYQGDQIQNLGVGGPVAAQYARFEDYHRLMKRRGQALSDEIFGEDKARVVVDSAPILERALAAKTSDGFIGKNTCFIHPEKGSFLLLGEIVTSIDLPFDEKIEVDPLRHLPSGGCGKCDRCQVRCPTGALDNAYSIDSNLCLSFWTIENRGIIPEKFWPWLKLYYFGCDICQLVCPYNKQEEVSRLPSDIAVRSFPPLFEIATMDQSQYEKWFGGTAMTRAKRNGLRRNALIAMTVSGDPRLEEALVLAKSDAEAPIGETIEQIERYLLGSPTSLRIHEVLEEAVSSRTRASALADIVDKTQRKADTFGIS